MKQKLFAFFNTLLSAIIILLVSSCPSKAQETLYLNKSEIFLQVESSETLTANIENVKWTTADSRIAKVENGKVTGVAAGNTVVRAIWEKQIATCKVQVGGIKFEKNEYSVAVGKTVQISAEVQSIKNDGDKTISWKSEAEDIATVDSNGIVTGMKIGKTQIVATCGELQSKCNLEVTEKELEFEVNITNIKGVNADFSILPNKEGISYAFGIMTKAKYDKKKELGDAQNPPLGVFASDKAKYKQLADASGGTLKSWQEAAKANNFYKTGEQKGKVVDAGFLDLEDARPSTKCVFYYYLIKESDDKPQSEIFTKDFEFASESLSENKVRCEIKETYTNGVKADLYATNEDSYFVTICTEGLVKWYTEGAGVAQGKTLKDMAYKLIATAESYQTFSWGTTVTPKKINAGKPENCTAGTTYYLVWFVYDAENGVRSDVWLKGFTSSDKKWTD